MLKGSKDTVKNVKISFAKCSKKIMKTLQGTNSAMLKAALTEMINDPD